MAPGTLAPALDCVLGDKVLPSPTRLLYSLFPGTPKGTLIKFRVEAGPTQSWSHPGLGSPSVSPNGCLPCPALSLRGVIYGPITTQASEGLQDGLLPASQEQGGGFHYHPSAAAGPEKADTATRHRGLCTLLSLLASLPGTPECHLSRTAVLTLWLWGLGINTWVLTSLSSASHSRVTPCPLGDPGCMSSTMTEALLVCGPYIKVPSPPVPPSLLQAATGPGAISKHLLGSPCLATVPRAMWLGPRRYKGLTKREQACPQLAEDTGPRAGAREPATNTL